MSAKRIAEALGGACRSGAWWRCRCPVHHSRGPTLALRDGDRALILHCHGGCDWRDIFAELRRGGLLDGGAGVHRSPAMNRQDDRHGGEHRIEIVRRIWDAARDAPGSPVARYLAGRRITLPAPPSLRWSPTLWRSDGTYAPAMVARVDSLDGTMIGVHRTWIVRDAAGIWRRRDRASLGPIGGGAVRLAPATETLMVGEGIETCLSAMQATGLPAWAALGTSGLARLVLPAEVQNVIILADHDANGAGERAARSAAQRWLRDGRRVQLAVPPEPDTDFADVMVGHASTAMKASDAA